MTRPNFANDGNFAPNRERDGGGAGSSSDIMEYRVSRLEDDVAEIKRSLDAIKADIAEMKGMLSRIPSTQQLWAMTIGSWIAGSGIVFAAVRFLP
ncbi:MAG: hypothetical protein AAGK33_07370 [Pseudomonadota bacterium]